MCVSAYAKIISEASRNIDPVHSCLLARTTILVVDDNPQIRDIVPHLLEAVGGRSVLVCDSPEKAYAYCDREKIGIVLMDVFFPNSPISGMDAALHIQKQNDIPVVLMTGLIEDTQLRPISHAKPYGFICKPFSPMELKYELEIALVKHKDDVLERTQKKLRKFEARYKAIVDKMSDYVFTVDFSSGHARVTIHSGNCWAVTGYDPDVLMSEPLVWKEMVVPEDRAKVKHFFSKLMRGRQIMFVEYRIRRHDGTIRWVRNTPIVHHAPHRRQLSFDCVISDVTDQKHAEEAHIDHMVTLEILVNERTRVLTEVMNDLEEKNRLFQAAEAQIAFQLEEARKVQKLFFPQQVVVPEYLDIDYISLPYEPVSGDFLNFMTFAEENRLGVFICDVSGHGVPAALYIGGLKTMTNHLYRKYAYQPAAYLTVLNEEFIAAVNHDVSTHFLTGIYGYFQKENGSVSFHFANAGHPPPLVYRVRSKHLEYINSRGALVGHFTGINFEEGHIDLDPGDMLFLHTDGLIEDPRDRENGYDYAPLISALEHADEQGLSIQAANQEIIKRKRTHKPAFPFHDDIMLFGVKVRAI